VRTHPPGRGGRAYCRTDLYNLQATEGAEPLIPPGSVAEPAGLTDGVQIPSPYFQAAGREIVGIGLGLVPVSSRPATAPHPAHAAVCWCRPWCMLRLFCLGPPRVSRRSKRADSDRLNRSRSSHQSTSTAWSSFQPISGGHDHNTIRATCGGRVPNNFDTTLSFCEESPYPTPSTAA